jgi:DNA-binding NarL/FixJ family response regulator
MPYRFTWAITTATTAGTALPGMDGLTAAEQLHTVLPSCQTLVLTGMTRSGNLLRALKVGVRGFIPTDAPADMLANGARCSALVPVRPT